MKFETKLISGTLIQRYKRFLADVKLSNGEIITAHCANPGAMLGLKDPGLKVWLSKTNNPKRKLKYSWELIEFEATNSFVGINTNLPNKLVEEAINASTIKELQGYLFLKREVKYGQNSRIDFLLSKNKEGETSNSKNCYVEVKNVHLLRTQSLAEFPDSITKRGTKHLNELANMAKDGHRAVMLYIIQRDDADTFALANDIDPAYAKAFQDAKKEGVEAIAYQCHLDTKEIRITTPIKLNIM